MRLSDAMAEPDGDNDRFGMQLLQELCHASRGHRLSNAGLRRPVVLIQAIVKHADTAPRVGHPIA
jgi:hypothetical protein